MPLDALIFDVDGTLAETEEIHRAAFNDTFAANALPWSWDRARYGRLLATTGGKERIRAHADEIGFAISDDRIAAMHGAKTERYAQLVAGGGIALRPGIDGLVRSAREAGKVLAIATTTTRSNVDALSKAVFARPADDIFAVIAAGDEVTRKKPAPDVYELCLDRLGLEPAVCVALEDSANGVRAARAAGVRTIVCPGMYTADEDFSGATAVVRSFEEIASVDIVEELLAASARGQGALHRAGAGGPP